jgi:hypothetical protein
MKGDAGAWDHGDDQLPVRLISDQLQILFESLTNS